MDARMSISEAASELGISVQAVHKRISSGTLDGVKTNIGWQVSSRSVADAKKEPPKKGRPWRGETYLLMSGPYEVMTFTYRPETDSFMPGDVIDPERAPLGTVSREGRGKSSGLKTWWQHRSIPGSRAGMDEKLRSLGLEDPSQIPFRNLGLSLSDQYWICPADHMLRWKDINYFQNDFGSSEEDWDTWLAEVGLSSPDNTSEGALPKRWLCREGERILLKGHIPWTDQQVYNESVATALHSRLLAPSDFVPYEVQQVETLGVVSACPCFLSFCEEYVPMSLVLEVERSRKGELLYDTVVRACSNRGIPTKVAEEQLAKMIVCDNIMANTDRHLRNFGLIRNIDDLRWRFAPLFDTGNSLWYDKDESAVARGDYKFLSRPFNDMPNRQLMYASEVGWFDAKKLEGFADEACEILAEGDLSRWRLDYLHEGIDQRIRAIQELLG